MGNSANSLPYTIGKQVTTAKDGWVTHEGKRKSDNFTVTVFVAKKPQLAKASISPRSPHMTQLRTAMHHFQHCKKLRHPHILQVLATLDTDSPEASGSTPPPSGKAETGDLIVVTEPCVSLETWLQSNPPPEQVAWGLESVVRALHFLHASANLAHGNVCPESLVVTPAGDVKLWNFSLVTGIIDQRLSAHFTDYEGAITPDPYRSPERQEGRWDALGIAGLHAMDSFSTGVLIQHFFRHQLPQPLVKAVQRMLTPNLKMRPRLQPLLKCPIFDTPYQKVQLQLEEFTVQAVEQKIAFWQNLTPNMQAGIFPETLSVHKLLPLIKTTVATICQSDSMKSQDMYRREVLATIQPMFYIAKTYLGDKAKQEIAPIVATLFTVNDRAIRGCMLQNISFLSKLLDKNALNQAVFEPACSGFSDSSSTLRELTLKATLELVPQLNQPNLEKLSRYLVRLQSDPEAGIRTNTVIVFSKLAPHLTDMSRQKLLLPAFIRAMKDPFVPCRLSALKSTLKVKEFFTPTELAGKVLPAVTPQLLDAVKDVRKEAFAVVDDLLFVLRSESERMVDAPAPVVPATPSSGGVPSAPKPVAAAPAPASGSYLSGISSWMSSSAKPTTNGTAQMSQSAHVSANRSQISHSTHSAVTSMQQPTVEVSDGWGDDDGLDSPIKTEVSPAAKTNLVFSQPPSAPTLGGNGDIFAGFDNKPARRPIINKKTVGTTAVAKPVVMKLDADADDDDGWDDF